MKIVLSVFNFLVQVMTKSSTCFYLVEVEKSLVMPQQVFQSALLHGEIINSGK